MSENPYAASPSDFRVNDYSDINSSNDVEAVRRRYLSHEASIRSVGLLYYLGAFFGMFAAVFYGLMATGAIVNPEMARQQHQGIAMVMFGVMAVLAAGFSIFQGFVAYGLLRLLPYSRIAGSIVAGFGLLVLPIGTVISAYILYLLLSAKGEYVFSPQYRVVREQTPHIRYKVSIIIWILGGLLGLLFLLAFVGLMVGLIFG